MIVVTTNDIPGHRVVRVIGMTRNADPAVLAGLQHPPELDAEPKRTCMGALGASFIAGAEDGPAPGEEGVSCNASPDVLARRLRARGRETEAEVQARLRRALAFEPPADALCIANDHDLDSAGRRLRALLFEPSLG